MQVLEKWRQADTWSSLVIQFSQSVSSRCSERPFRKKSKIEKQLKKMSDVDLWPPHTYLSIYSLSLSPSLSSSLSPSLIHRHEHIHTYKH